MTNQNVQSSETGNSRWSWLRIIGGVSSLIAGMLLSIGMISLIVTLLRFETSTGWSSLIQDNWLVKIFILHAGFKDLHADLHGLNLLDVFILVLVSVICLSVSMIFKKARRVWSLIAFSFSIIAITLFLATQLAGRSGVMLAVLIISLVIFGDKTFGKATASIGILASVLLFAGDFTVGMHSHIITVLFVVGYLLLITWFFLIAQCLFRLNRSS